MRVKFAFVLGGLAALMLGLALHSGASAEDTLAALPAGPVASGAQFLAADGIEGPPGDDEVPVPVPAQVCWCTNLGGVTVICPDCDNEPIVDLCFTHDAACQAAAKAGGIREWNLFFCTTGH